MNYFKPLYKNIYNHVGVMSVFTISYKLAEESFLELMYIPLDYYHG